MLIIGAMMRKLIHVAFGVLKSGVPFSSRRLGWLYQPSIGAMRWEAGLMNPTQPTA
jgi:hypothetical protein